MLTGGDGGDGADVEDGGARTGSAIGQGDEIGTGTLAGAVEEDAVVEFDIGQNGAEWVANVGDGTEEYAGGKF